MNHLTYNFGMKNNFEQGGIVPLNRFMAAWNIYYLYRISNVDHKKRASWAHQWATNKYITFGNLGGHMHDKMYNDPLYDFSPTGITGWGSTHRQYRVMSHLLAVAGWCPTYQQNWGNVSLTGSTEVMSHLPAAPGWCPRCRHDSSSGSWTCWPRPTPLPCSAVATELGSPAAGMSAG